MRLSYELDPSPRAQLGMIVLQADETLESDLRRLLPPDADLLVSRVPSGETVTSETLRAMEGELTGAAALLPRGAGFRAIGYGCTSGAAEIGPARVAELVRAGVATPEVTEPVSALVAACRDLGITKIGMISPYVASVSKRLRDVLERGGVETVAFASFEEPLEANVVRISERSIIAAGLEMGRRDDCEAVFLSCTNLRTLDVIAGLEAEIGKPVLASNQVLGWHLCRLAGLGASEDAPGQLFER